MYNIQAFVKGKYINNLTNKEGLELITLEELKKQYKSTPSNSKTIEEATLTIMDAIKVSENYRLQVTCDTDELTSDIVDLQNRILDGYDYAMDKLLNSINEDNFEEISKLTRFLRNKLQINMWITESEKKKIYFKENNILPKENSLFVEIFFAEKFQEITGKSLIKRNK